MRLKRIAAWGLAITMALSLDIPGVNAASGVIDTTPVTAEDGVLSKEEQIALAKGSEDTPGQIPGTDRTFFDENDDMYDWFNVSGYAADGVQDRSLYYAEYVENGYKDTANYKVVEEDGYQHKTTKEFMSAEDYKKLSSTEKENYNFISAEAQFTAALSARAKVIQVNAKELELGYLYLSRNQIAPGPVKQHNNYKDGKKPITSPVLMEEFDGTGISDVDLYSHLTIFSTTGCMIRHAGFNLEKCEDVIIRNFQFEGMYEWDEPSYGGTSYDSHKRFGWCNLTCNESNDIWVDHCTFGFSFDGNIDLKNGSSASVTWCRFGYQDLSTGTDDLNNLPKWNKSTGSELWKNILYMEECYQDYLKTGNKDNYYPEYYSLRGKEAQNGATPKEIMEYGAFHSKVHLVGSGDKDLYTNVNEKISIGYSKYTNVIQRVPMVRSGNGLMYNCIVDNTAFQERVDAIKSNPNASRDGVHFYSGYISVNNARNGASIGTDTSIFKEVTPNCGEEKYTPDPNDKNVTTEWKPLIAQMVNHNLTVNSKVSIDNKEYIGSSWDREGDNLFNRKWTWSDNSSIGDWKWSKWEGLDDFLTGTTVNTNEISKKMIAYGSNLYKDYYVGQYELGFSYKCFDLNKVETMLEQYGGVQKSGIYGANETPLDYIQPVNAKAIPDEYKLKVTIYVDGAVIADGFMLNDTYFLQDGNNYFLTAGESFTLPTEEDMTKDHYIFKGWKKRVYQADGTLGELSDFLEDLTITPGAQYADEVYYAIWEQITHQVTFNSMGGSSVGPLTVGENNTIASATSGMETNNGLPISTKEGAELEGWYRTFNPYEGSEDRGTYSSRLNNGSTRVNADMTLYAKWNYRVTFDTNGAPAIETRMVASGDKVSTTANPLSNPEKNGYTFVGWFTDGGRQFDVAEEEVWEPMTLHARFRRDGQATVTVTLVTNIEGAEGPETIEVEVGATGSAIEAFIPDNPNEKLFFGWYTDEECTTLFDPDAVIEYDITLYAGWRTKGDLNGIGDAPDTDDAAQILRHVVGNDVITDKRLIKIGDLNENGGLDTDDAAEILKIVVGGKG